MGKRIRSIKSGYWPARNNVVSFARPRQHAPRGKVRVVSGKTAARQQRELAGKAAAEFISHCQTGGAVGQWPFSELYDCFISWRHIGQDEARLAKISGKAFGAALTRLGIGPEREVVWINGRSKTLALRTIPEPTCLRLAA